MVWCSQKEKYLIKHWLLWHVLLLATQQIQKNSLLFQMETNKHNTISTAQMIRKCFYPILEAETPYMSETWNINNIQCFCL